MDEEEFLADRARWQLWREAHEEFHDPLVEKPVYENKNSTYGKNPRDSKQHMRSSWGDSIIGDECLHVPKQEATTTEHYAKKKVVSASIISERKSMTAVDVTSPQRSGKSASSSATFCPSTKAHTKVQIGAIDEVKETNPPTAFSQISSQLGMHTMDSSDAVTLCDSTNDVPDEPKIDDIEDASNGLSMLAR